MPKFYTVDRAGFTKQDNTFNLDTDYSNDLIWRETRYCHDRSNLIKRLKEFYPEGLSRHGIRYLVSEGLVYKSPKTGAPIPFAPVEPMIESIFELIRQNYFPDKPSRMQSMFAWCNIDDAKKFNESCANDYSIFEVESNHSFVADQNLLFLGGSVIDAYEMAYRYWSGNRSENYKPEVVIPLPATIGNRI